jgi:hypothetical protein
MFKNMDLQLANSRLQARVQELEQQLGEVTLKLADSRIHLNRAHSKIAELQEVKRAKEVVQDNSKRVVVVTSNKANPNKALPTKQKIKSRQKVIYGILKNPSRYNLTSVEKNFLVSIENIKTLSQKQYDWLNSIKGRVK